MAVTPFQSIPKARLFPRKLVPATLGFFLGMIAMGVFSNQQMFQPKPLRAADGNVETKELSWENADQGAIAHWKTIVHFATHVPEACWGENAINDFQRRQCEDFWEHLQYGAALSLLPFALSWFFWIVASIFLHGPYQRAQKRVSAGKPISKGTVTEPAQAPEDAFSRVFFFRPIGVQLPDKSQIKVYIPVDAQIPTPGQVMAIFEPVQIFGSRRHFAVIYAPHVAVVAGVRRA